MSADASKTTERDGLALARSKMTAAGVDDVAIDVFAHYYAQLREGGSGVIREEEIRPLSDPARLQDVTVDDGTAREALSRTVLIKLNGGLGTSMGMTQAKSLLPVRDGRTFLDLIIAQVLTARGREGVRLPLLLMDSFNTREDTLAALAAYPDLPVDDLPLDFLQSQEPKLRADDLTPVEWPADPALEWCPPGHGDLYPSLYSTGILRRLVDAGFRYASVSNSDNLGAGPDGTLAGWFAASGAPYAAEICRRSPMDRKGGHLAVRTADDRLVLRETAQTLPEEMDLFTDERRHPFFHTNNLWFDLERLLHVLTARGGVLGLPLIKNVKTVDPSDPGSPTVIQVESAMGAAIEVFEGATAIEVPRRRFLPVKTTNELLLLRSDVYDVRLDGTVALTVDAAPTISLDRHYTRIADFERRFPAGAPSLREASSLTVEGDWTFEEGVVVTGDTVLPAADGARHVPAGTRLP